MASELPTKDVGLDRHDDPFAPREGKTLIWKDINMTLVCAVPTLRLCRSSVDAFWTPLNLTLSSFFCFCDAILTGCQRR
jgi:hypothetical protein